MGCPDETGWHLGGLNAWHHALVGPDATAYVIAPNRSGDVAEALDREATALLRDLADGPSAPPSALAANAR